MQQADAEAAARRIRGFFEQIKPADLGRMDLLYTDNARFKDPFNEVQGVAAIRAIFEHMFVNLQGPRFVVHEVLVQGSQCFMTWEFMFRQPRMGADEQCIRGSSHLVLADDGRISLHRDYWDAAEELYEKLPLLGGVMRWLKKRASS